MHGAEEGFARMRSYDYRSNSRTVARCSTFRIPVMLKGCFTIGDTSYSELNYYLQMGLCRPVLNGEVGWGATTLLWTMLRPN